MSETKDIVAESLTVLNGENSSILFSTYGMGVDKTINLTVSDAGQTITLAVPFKLMGDFLKLTLEEIAIRMMEEAAGASSNQAVSKH